MSAAALLGAGTGLNALVNYFHGKKSLALNERIFEHTRADQAHRFEADMDLRHAQLNFTMEEATRLRLERLNNRNEDFQRSRLKNRDDRSFLRLQHAFSGSPEGIWLHDPYTNGHNIKSLRVFFQKPAGVLTAAYPVLEQAIVSGVKEYEQIAPDSPIHFPTGVWSDNARTGSWVATELHAWDQATPTLILRANPRGNNEYALEADIFGFPIGDRNFVQNIGFGIVKNDLNQVTEALPLLALATADMYFSYTYGLMPALPTLLPRYLANTSEDTSQAVDSIVGSYKRMVLALAQETPEIGLLAAFNLAESLTALSDRDYAVRQIQEVEEVSKYQLPDQPAFVQRLSALYAAAGANEDAQRLLLAYPPNPESDRSSTNYATLERFL
ncbi:MAG: hypothetical protein V4621_05240 [Pseudomonadota bacterium]